MGAYQGGVLRHSCGGRGGPVNELLHAGAVDESPPLSPFFFQPIRDERLLHDWSCVKDPVRWSNHSVGWTINVYELQLHWVHVSFSCFLYGSVIDSANIYILSYVWKSGIYQVGYYDPMITTVDRSVLQGFKPTTFLLWDNSAPGRRWFMHVK